MTTGPGVAERADDFEDAVRVATRARQASIQTALPAVVVSYDPVKQTVSAQPTIQGQRPTATGLGAPENLPVCPDCPVSFPKGGGYAITWPLNPGDEGVLVFMSRCMDSWWQSGGIQPQAEMRMHDLSDGVFLPGATSQPMKLANVYTGGMEMRNTSGSMHVRMSPSGIDILGNVTVTGTVMATGNVSSQADVLAQTVSLHNHVHLGVTTGTALSGTPKP